MQVVALGAGDMGQWAARTVARDDRVEELVVADRNAAAAAELAASIGPRARPATVDVQDAASLGALLREADAVANTVGPFYRFGVPVLRAAIEARCHYLDICDDWEPTLEMLALDAQAREAGVTAVIGLGASPGLSNLLAAKAIRALDSAESVLTVWSLEGAVPEAAPAAEGRAGPSAAMVHGVHQLTGKIRAFDGGREQDARPLRRIELDYPGIGRRQAWTIGHPETVTLPRVFPTLRSSANAMFGKPGTITAVKVLTSLVDWRLASVERAAGWMERLEHVAGGDDPFAMLKTGISGPPPLPPLFALASGTREGKPERVGVALAAGPPGGMGPVTGIPLALGVSLLADGALEEHGVFPPEGIVEPDALLEKLVPYCEPKVASAAELAVMSPSWKPVPFWEAAAGA